MPEGRKERGGGRREGKFFFPSVSDVGERANVLAVVDGGRRRAKRGGWRRPHRRRNATGARRKAHGLSSSPPPLSPHYGTVVEHGAIEGERVKRQAARHTFLGGVAIGAQGFFL